MPFYIRLASNERLRLARRTTSKAQAASSNMREFCLGVSFGIGVLTALFATYWIIGTFVTGFPNLQSLQSYWLGA